MNVIGLGQAGCNIADMLSQYSQYKVYKIDVASKVKNAMMLSVKKAQKNMKKMLLQ